MKPFVTKVVLFALVMTMVNLAGFAGNAPSDSTAEFTWKQSNGQFNMTWRLCDKVNRSAASILVEGSQDGEKYTTIVVAHKSLDSLSIAARKKYKFIKISVLNTDGDVLYFKTEQAD